MGGARAVGAERRAGRRAIVAGPVLMLAAFLGMLSSPGCGDPAGVDGTREYRLASIAGMALPASFTDGTCTPPLCVFSCQSYPDRKYVLDGYLKLDGKSFEADYSWKGETPECCASGPRQGPTWHRRASGSYTDDGSRLQLSDAASHLYASRVGTAIVVDSWGDLRQLRYVPK